MRVAARLKYDFLVACQGLGQAAQPHLDIIDVPQWPGEDRMGHA
jgi:hypothetical protein